MAKNKQSIKIDADAQGFIQEIEKSTKSITSLNKELKLNQQQLKGSENNTDLLTTRVQELKERYEQQTKIVENTNKAYQKSVELFGENSEETEKWKNKLVEAKEKQENYKNALNETNKKLMLQSEACIKVGEKIEKLGNKLTTAGEKIEKVGNKLSVVSAGIVAVAGGSLKASIDFESAFAGVEKTVDATTEQLEELKQGILDMSTKLPSSAVEISAVAEAAGQLGIQTDNVLSFTKTMIDMGNSTNLSSDEAATSLARFANITQMSQKDFDKLGSSIVDLGNNFATTESEIVEMALRLAGAGHQVGMSEGQILGLATALSSVGIEAEMGGSALSKAMVKMQNAVEMGGKKLDSVLKKTGMSLRELELMSANDSMGFKALADEIGMTSTELKQFITAGTNLQDFASISGMTAEQFKKAWKEDATSALTAFIKGLGTAEEKGESAIVLLTEMGLSEVRLRDSLLRAANAGNLFNSAIETGTKAWKDNTALTNEATKRYATTESQMKMLKNEAVKLGIEFGNELAPSLRTLLKDIKPVLLTVSNAVKKFSELDSTTKQNVIRFTAMVAVAGPLVKTIGNITTGTGNLIKSYGNAIKCVGNLSAKLSINQTTLKANTTTTIAATTATKLQTTATTTQAVATSGATLATNALKVAMIALPFVGVVTGIISVISMMKTFSESQEGATQSTESLKNEINELKDARQELTDTQKKQVNEGLSEIKHIQNLCSELKNLTEENGKVKEGYEGRVNFILNEVNEALGTEYKLTDGVIQKYDELTKSIDNLILKKKAQTILDSQEEKYKNALNEYGKVLNNLVETEQEYLNNKDKLLQKEKELQENQAKGGMENLKLTQQLKEEVSTLKEKTDTYEQQKEVLQGYYDDIAIYEQNASLIASGTAENLQKVADSVNYSYQKRSNSAVENLKIQIANEEYQLGVLKQNFKDTEDDKWKIQIESSEKRIQSLKDELKAQTSTLNTNTSVVEAYKSLCSKVCAEGEKIDLSNVGEKWIKSLNKGLKDNVGLLNGTMTSVAAALSVKTNNINVSSTSGHADGLAYVPYDNYVARLHEGERVLTKKENAEYIRNNISNKNSRNVTLNIYTQSVTDGEIRRIKRVIESDWGDRI